MTTTGDLILVHVEGVPAFFGRIEDISADIKPGWFNVHIMVLSIPPQVITWILEEVQINGKTFTMGGTPIRIEKVESMYKRLPQKKDDLGKQKVISLKRQNKPDAKDTEKEDESEAGSKVISLMDRFKK
jgi:hypothetical protein